MFFTFGKWSSYYLYPLIAGILKLISFGVTLEETSVNELEL